MILDGEYSMRGHLISVASCLQAAASPAHGLNERIRVISLMNGRHFLYEIVKLYSNEP